MGIDISKLDGLMKELATLSDVVKKDGQLEGSEVSIFKGYADNALNNGQISLEDFSAVFGIEITETKPVTQPETVTTNPMSRKERRAAKKEANVREDAVKEAVEEMVKNNVKPQDLMAALNKKFSNPEYQSVLNDVAYILNAVNSTGYNSKEDIEKIHDTIKKQLKSADKWDGFHKDILGYLESQAESNQISKEYETLKERYKAIKATMANTDIVKSQGDNFKAYVEILKDELQEKGADGKKEWDKSYTKEAFKLVEEYAKSDAKAVMESRLPETEGTSARRIKKELKAQNKGGDDYQADAIGELKTERKIFARRNTVNERNTKINSISRDDLKKELGRDLFEKLNRSYLPTVMNEDGTYDLTKLSDEILTRVGADYQLNQSKDHEMAELTNVQRHLNSLGIDVSEKEAKKLVKFCDIEREKRDRSLKALGNKLLGGIPGVVAGAVGAYNSTSVRDINVDQSVELVINDSEVLKKLTEQLESGGIKYDLTNLENGASVININQHVLIPGDNLWNNLIKNAGAGALIGALWGLCDWAIGDVKDEKSCLSISDYDKNDPKYTDAEQYKAYISEIYSNNPEKIKSLHLLVDAYKEAYGDNWHVEFWQKLRDMAGIGSKLNPEECLMMKYLKPEKPVQTTPVETTPVQDENNTPDTTPEETCAATIEDEYTDTTFTYTRQGGDTWKEIVKAFYPCLEEEFGMFGKDGAIRRLKKALSYNEDGSFNKETYKALLEGGDLPKTMKLPAQIDGCDRVDNAKVKKVKIQSGGKAKIQAVGNGSGYYIYTAKDECDGQTATGSSIQEALANLKAKTGKTYTNEQDLLK